MNLLNADLHCHSVVSDGTLQPEALAQRAKANGVELWALTDHDEVGGQQRARDAARALGLRLPDRLPRSRSASPASRCTSSAWASTPTTPRCATAWPPRAAGAASARWRCPTSLAKVGIKGAYDGALKYVGNPELISRTHFARYLVETGVCSDTNEVFRQLPDRRQTGLRAAPLGRAAATPCAGSPAPAAWR